MGGKTYRSPGSLSIINGVVTGGNVILEDDDGESGSEHGHSTVQFVSHQTLHETNGTFVGDHNTISGANVTVYGNNNQVSGVNADVYGDSNIVSGVNCRAHGLHNSVYGVNASAKGDYSSAEGVSSRCEGLQASATGTNSKAKNRHYELEPIKVPIKVEKNPHEKADSAPKKVCKSSSGEDEIRELLESITETRPLKKVCTPSLDEDELGVLATEMGEDVKADGEMACVVCAERKRQLSTRKCRHLCLCFACAKKLIDQHDVEFKCPVCREPVKEKLDRIFLN